MKLSRRAVQEAFDAGRLSMAGLQALAGNESGPEAMRALEAITSAGGASPGEPVATLLADARALALDLLRDKYAGSVAAPPVALAPAVTPEAVVHTPPALWESVKELLAGAPGQSTTELGAERIETAAARLMHSSKPEIRERAVKVAESAQGRRLYALTGNSTAHAIEVGGKPVVVRGASVREAEAIRAELEALTVDGYGRGMPNRNGSPGEVWVLDEPEYRRMVGPKADDYDGRVVTYADRGRWVVRRDAVTRSFDDGTSVRQALLPSIDPMRPYAATPLGNETVRRTLVRGSNLSPELLRGLSDVDAVVAIMNTRLEDPMGEAERALIDRENVHRAEQGKQPLKYLYVPIRDHSVPGQSEIRALVNALTDPKNQPLYVHCFAGIGRTGVVTAMAEIIAGDDAQTAVDRFSDFVAGMGVKGEASHVQRDFIVEFARRWKAGEFRDAVHTAS